MRKAQLDFHSQAIGLCEIITQVGPTTVGREQSFELTWLRIAINVNRVTQYLSPDLRVCVRAYVRAYVRVCVCVCVCVCVNTYTLLCVVCAVGGSVCQVLRVRLSTSRRREVRLQVLRKLHHRRQLRV